MTQTFHQKFRKGNSSRDDSAKGDMERSILEPTRLTVTKRTTIIRS
jgi:hypothetical protein